MKSEEELIEVAMTIIIHAGDGRVKGYEAIEFARNGHFDQARVSLKEAHDEIVIAHHSQTNIIQGEMSGEKHAHSLLFAHAQDTLMTIASEVKLMAIFVELFEKMSHQS
ncbi:PTS lactose/cellobiose transporter subunit IIA [Vagococcus intermedius]|uniref:PTS lactose/cellobiose transporter subunit IIA n=1 Tax=Vagococcus intermedius TaxID=2991418 RepID=A0AAF0CUC3_9ENTE|nr:PTS lactose/cellobiose transporter subunit IIA [Vagococcus intermedius]WEG73104.1 PTS lactose/cellobiose transporter subunit IIA [Vagococcus intermedius]WEG75188.1 PTS lactose/cellobiose transporter subunit IIA [Vagococcus intermedius]